MSTQPDQSDRSPLEECKCPDCDTVRYKWDFDDGRYCDTECRTRHDGQQALAQFKYDHTLCFTCLNTLKDVNPPKPEWEFTANGHGWTRNADGEFTLEYYDQSVTRDAAMGFQFLTRFADKGEKQRGDHVITGTICNHCGQTNPFEHDEIVADHHAIERLIELFARHDDYRIDTVRFHREYEATRDIDLAAGRVVTDTDE